MSAPSNAWFIKNGLIVGMAHVNIGWSWSNRAFIHCLWEGWHDAKSYFDKPLTEQQLAGEWNKRFGPYFTTREELLAFDHVYIYSMMIPRIVYEALHRDPAYADDVGKMVAANLFDDTDNEWKTVVEATKIARGID